MGDWETGVFNARGQLRDQMLAETSFPNPLPPSPLAKCGEGEKPEKCNASRARLGWRCIFRDIFPMVRMTDPKR